MPAHRRVTPMPRISTSRYLDGPDAFPRAKDHPPEVRLPIGTPSIGLLTEPTHELYRVRTMSHLYDDWHVEFVMDLERAPVGHVHLDCHTCKVTSTVTDDTDGTCPRCGTVGE